ncbi:MAG TPA: hypothetical protein PLX89_04125 [Verrucomicrobiota bacterium]|nr:hypothetical protein [Verrucomicrobiales bacterium]HRI12171.1 hypothetical protein [Verrucomicrobiota bacterium]
MNHPPLIPRTGLAPGRRTGSVLRYLVLGVTATFLAAVSVQASVYVQQLKLDALCKNAHRIIRGTVDSVSSGQISVGGGSLPTVTYRIKVTETMAGAPAEIVNLTMVAEPKTAIRHGNARREPLIEVPPLEEGKEYLLFTTKPSKIGLTSPVGLAQGLFSIKQQGDKVTAVNGVNNAGLGLGSGGPVAYQELAARIRALRPN